MSDYPIPSYAANIWIAGDKIWLGFPSPVNGARPHSIALPLSDKGMAVALDIIRERANNKFLTLGNRGAPTKWDIENDRRYNTLLREMNKAKETSAAEKAEAERFLEELGL